MKRLKKGLSVIICIAVLTAIFTYGISAAELSTADTSKSAADDSKAEEELNKFGVTEECFEEIIKTTTENVTKEYFEKLDISKDDFDWDSMYPKGCAFWNYFWEKAAAVSSNTEILNEELFADENDPGRILADTIINSMLSFFDENDTVGKTEFIMGMIEGEGELTDEFYNFVTKYFPFSDEVSITAEPEAKPTGN